MNAQELACAGPTHSVKIRPKIQNIVVHLHNSRMIDVVMRPISEIMITFLGPIRSSTAPC